MATMRAAIAVVTFVSFTMLMIVMMASSVRISADSPASLWSGHVDSFLAYVNNPPAFSEDKQKALRMQYSQGFKGLSNEYCQKSYFLI